MITARPIPSLPAAAEKASTDERAVRRGRNAAASAPVSLCRTPGAAESGGASRRVTRRGGSREGGALTLVGLRDKCDFATLKPHVPRSVKACAGEAWHLLMWKRDRGRRRPRDPAERREAPFL